MAPASPTLPKAFEEISGPGRAIGCNRPLELYTIPLVLLHEPFAIFKTSEAAPLKQVIDCFNQLAHAACSWHPPEALAFQRRLGIEFLLDEYLGLGIDEPKMMSTRFTTERNLSTTMPIIISERKKDAGDAFNQAVLHYGKFLIKAFDHPHRYYNYNTRFPCILLVDMDLFLGFYGAVWDGTRVRVEPLTKPSRSNNPLVRKKSQTDDGIHPRCIRRRCQEYPNTLQVDRDQGQREPNPIGSLQSC